MRNATVSALFSCFYTGGSSTEANVDASGVFHYGPELQALQNMYGYEMFGNRGPSPFYQSADPNNPNPGGGYQFPPYHTPGTPAPYTGGPGTGGAGDIGPNTGPGGGLGNGDPGGGPDGTGGLGPGGGPGYETPGDHNLEDPFTIYLENQTAAGPNGVQQPSGGGSTTTVSRGGGGNTAAAAAPAQASAQGGGYMTPEQARQFASQEWYRDQLRTQRLADPAYNGPNSAYQAGGGSTPGGGTFQGGDILALGNPMQIGGGKWARQGGGQHEITNFAAFGDDPAAWAKNYGYTGAAPTEADLSALTQKYQSTQYNVPQTAANSGNPYWIDKTGVSHSSGTPDADAIYKSPGYSASGNSAATNGAPYGTSPENTAAAGSGMASGDPSVARMPVVPGPVRPPTTTAPPKNTPYIPPPDQYTIPPPVNQTYGIPPQENPSGDPVLDWGQQGASGNRNLAGAAAFASARDMYAHPDLAPEVQNAIAQQGMNATRAQFAGQRGQADRHRAVTGNSAGYAAGNAQSGREEAGAYGLQARQNTIDFEKEAQRRKETAQGQLQNLYQGESQYNLGLLGGLAGASSKLYGSDSSTRSRSANSPMVSL